MPKQSAGLLLFRLRDNAPEVLLVHPGGPFWARKDNGAWSVPKGEFSGDEAPLEAAVREVQEELGLAVSGPFAALGTVRQPGGKTVHAFAAPADFDPAQIVSNTFELEWPPRSGRVAKFPEVDRAGWFSLPAAAARIHAAQAPFLERFATTLNRG